MTPSAKKTNRIALRSTDRGGLLSLIAGILCLALGLGMLIGINSTAFRVSSATIAGLKDMALGLGGALYQLIPLFVLWLGWLLCISARHYVSFRTFGIALGIYAAVLAFMTLVTSVSGFGGLMQYVLNLNEKELRLASPDSFGQFLARALSKYENKFTHLPGGGALGMLVAFPMWRLFGEVGGPIVLGFAVLGMIAWLLRFNPIPLVQRMERRMHGGSPIAAQQPQHESTYAEPAAPATGPEEAEYYQPVREPYYVEPAIQNMPNTYAYASDPYATSLDQRAVYTLPASEAPDDTFVSQGKDFFEEFESEPVPQRRPRTNRSAVPGADPITQKMEAKEPLPQEASAPNQQLAAVDVPVTDRPGPSSDSEQQDELPWEDERPKSEPVQRVGTKVPKVHDVGVAPAVMLDGERVAVQNPTVGGISKPRMDGTASPKPAAKQIGIQLDNYERPPARLLAVPEASEIPDTTEEDLQRADKLIATLNSFNISATVQQIVHGPAITRFAIRLAEGVNVNRLRNVMDNLAVELLAKSAIRAEIPIPGTPLIGIEVSNDKSTKVYLSEVLQSPKMLEMRSPTAVALGKDIAGAPVVCELMDMPHLLIAGATGSGKSVCINSIITSLLYRATPREVRMILVDPKFVELQPYNDVPHLLLPVVVDPKKAVAALEWVCQEMDERYQQLQKYGVRNIDAYNKKLALHEEPLPRIIVIIDEMSDLMASAGKIIDEHVKRITAKARAAGICLILATQRPSVDVITGIIKANIPSRIAFQVSSQIDSRTILDSQGAEKLLGYGDMLYLPRSISAPKRVQGCFISDYEVGQVADYVKSRHQVDYNMDIMEHIESSGGAQGSGSSTDDSRGDEGVDEFDELLPKAIEMAVEAGQMSISMLQRVLRVGYGRAGRLIDEMARREIISGNEGTKPRKTLITRADYQAMFGDDGFD